MAKSLSTSESKMVVLQPSTLTYPGDHPVLEPRVKVQRLDSYRVTD